MRFLGSTRELIQLFEPTQLDPKRHRHRQHQYTNDRTLWASSPLGRVQFPRKRVIPPTQKSKKIGCSEATRLGPFHHSPSNSSEVMVPWDIGANATVWLPPAAA